MSIALNFKAVSDVGCIRSNNEDMGYANGKLVRDIVTEGSCTPPSAFAVADGMGGYEGGEIASEIVSRSFGKTVSEIIKYESEDKIIAALKNWAKEANRMVVETGTLRPELSEMGSTFVGLLFISDQLYMINIGDSRCYRMRGDVAKLLSADHSERNRTGNNDVPKNLIYNFMGNNPIDFFSDVTILSPIEGDTYLLCSDGLSDMLTEEEIEENFHNPDKLVDLAKKAGGKDNITAITIEITAETSTTENDI